jgi:DNA-binding response OmpR family regulator
MIGHKILIVDDDELLVGAIQRKFEAAGFRVTKATRGAQGRQLVESEDPDLIILDLALPDDDGTDICRDVRARSRVPIIMLTGRAEETDRIVGLELGADDYVTKPFSLSELVARARAVLRRTEPPREPMKEEPTVLDGLGVHVDLRAHEVLVGGEQVSLTPTEYKLLVALMRRQGEVVSAQELLEAVWGYDEYDTHLVEVHIANLRSKVERDPKNPERIQTLRSFGYRFG